MTGKVFIHATMSLDGFIRGDQKVYGGARSGSQLALTHRPTVGTAPQRAA